MNKKVLINVATPAIKKKILSMVIAEGYDFVEGSSYDDVKFKCDLLKDHIILYVHELDYTQYKKELVG